jgi:phosphoesterase RecJ-like protein
MIKSILDQFHNSRSILVASHTHPDGDAIGALLATGLALQAMGKQVRMFNETPIPAVYRFLPSVAAITQEFDPEANFDTVVILDCGCLERVGKIAPRVAQAAVLINVDHHVTNTRFGHLQLIEPAACATAEIVYRILLALPVQIDSAMATALYTGILTDTGSFRFANTNQAAFAICAELIARGANPYEVAQYVYGTYSLGRIKLLNLALDSLQLSPNGRLSVMTLTRRMLAETGTQPEDIEGIINYARRIEDVKVAALIQELGHNGGARSGKRQYHVSLRSDGDVDVARIAARFGGGGHPGAAGFNVESSLTTLKAEIMQWSETIPGLCA